MCDPRLAVSASFVRLAVFAALAFAKLSFAQEAPSISPPSALTRDAAVELAERFIRENGYTDAPESAVKSQLDYESIEWEDSRAELLKERRNTLRSNAIGIKATGDGWGVAFDYVADHPEICRIVTFLATGADIRIQHQDGIREYWLGFGDQ